MAASQTEIESQATELSAEAFEAFCDDVSGMFGVDMGCASQQACVETVEGLKERFKNLVLINSVKAEGVLEGTFQLIFSQEGLFTLGGLIAMPEQMQSLIEKCVGPQKTLQNIKGGSLEEAQNMSDAVTEAGNLLAGSWDRVFREKLEGHGHFAQANVFIGEAWANPEEKIGLTSNEELVFVPHKMTIGAYPSFDCGVIFPRTIFAKAEAEEKVKAEAEEKAKAEAEEKAKAEAEEKTKSEAKEKAKSEAEEKAEPEAKEKTEAKSDDVGADASDSAVEEAATTEDGKESTVGEVSKTIQRMTQSAAELPGEGAPSATTESPVVSSISEFLATCAKDIMQEDVVWGNSDDSVQQALSTMQQHDAGYMMVGENGALEGIVSKSDITGAISPYLRPMFAKWHRSLDDATLQIRIKWIMSRPVHTIKPDTSLATIMESMHQFGQRALPVVDQQGKVQGLVTVFDIFRILLNNSPNLSTAGKTPQTPPLA